MKKAQMKVQCLSLPPSFNTMAWIAKVGWAYGAKVALAPKVNHTAISAFSNLVHVVCLEVQIPSAPASLDWLENIWRTSDWGRLHDAPFMPDPQSIKLCDISGLQFRTWFWNIPFMFSGNRFSVAHVWAGLLLRTLPPILVIRKKELSLIMCRVLSLHQWVTNKLQLIWH